MLISSDIWLIGTIGTGSGGGEQFVDIYATIIDPLEVTIEVQEEEQITALVAAPEGITAVVAVQDSVDSDVETLEITVEVEEC